MFPPSTTPGGVAGVAGRPTTQERELAIGAAVWQEGYGEMPTAVVERIVVTQRAALVQHLLLLNLDSVRLADDGLQGNDGQRAVDLKRLRGALDLTARRGEEQRSETARQQT